MDKAAESLKRGLSRSSARDIDGQERSPRPGTRLLLSSRASASGDIHGQARARIRRDQAPREILRASPGAMGGVDASALLTAGSGGVFGLRDVSLSSTASDAARGSVVTSTGKSVHLEQGTRWLAELAGRCSAETRLGRK